MAMNDDVIMKEIKIDEKKAQKMLNKIILKERKNISTGENSDLEMIKKIKKIIEEDVECY